MSATPYKVQTSPYNHDTGRELAFPSLSITWVQQVVSILPFTVLFVAVLHAISLLKVLDSSLYNATSIEIIQARISSPFEYGFLILSLSIILLQIISVYWLQNRKKFGWRMLTVSSFLTILLNTVMISPIGIIFTGIWIYFLLQIRKEYL